MNTDPICGREISPKQSEYLAIIEGTAHHFCCAACRQQFLDNYAAAERINANDVRPFATIKASDFVEPSRNPQPVAIAV